MDIPAQAPHRRIRPVLSGLSSFFGHLSARDSLSRRLLLFTLFFVMIAEIAVYVPAILQARNRWLDERLTAARIAVLALGNQNENTVEAELETHLLTNADVLTVAVVRDDSRYLFLSDPRPREITDVYDISGHPGRNAVLKTFAIIFNGKGKVAHVVDSSKSVDGHVVEIVVDLAPLQKYLIRYSKKILTFSLSVFFIMGIVIYCTLYWMLVRPIRRITNAIAEFRRAPETHESILTPSSRTDEIGLAERQLAAMQQEVHNALSQKRRLAALGSAVTRINHDLRNILASGQILTEQLSDSREAKVQRLTPRITGVFARAIALCVNTLKYSQTEESTIRRGIIPLAGLIDDIGEGLPLSGSPPVRYTNNVDRALCLEADREYLMRIFLNLTRNAVEALQEAGHGGEVTIEAEIISITGGARCVIRVSDTGPGLPRRVIENLFEPFTGYGRAQGTGLGLAISRELARAHGGDIKLEHSGPLGSSFIVILPHTEKAETKEYARRLAVRASA